MTSRRTTTAPAHLARTTATVPTTRTAADQLGRAVRALALGMVLPTGFVALVWASALPVVGVVACAVALTLAYLVLRARTIEAEQTALLRAESERAAQQARVSFAATMSLRVTESTLRWWELDTTAPADHAPRPSTTSF